MKVFISTLLFLCHIVIALQTGRRTVSNPFLARDICSSNGQVDCEQSCMPLGAQCCDDGSSTFCPVGQYCIPNACCPIGETCDGGGGGTTTVGTVVGTATAQESPPPSQTVESPTPTSTSITSGPGSCSSSGEAICEALCMPIDAVCCDDGTSSYCPNGQYCVPGGCCPNGEECTGSGGNTLTIPVPIPTQSLDSLTLGGTPTPTPTPEPSSLTQEEPVSTPVSDFQTIGGITQTSTTEPFSNSQSSTTPSVPVITNAAPGPWKVGKYAVALEAILVALPMLV